MKIAFAMENIRYVDQTYAYDGLDLLKWEANLITQEGNVSQLAFKTTPLNMIRCSNDSLEEFYPPSKE